MVAMMTQRAENNGHSETVVLTLDELRFALQAHFRAFVLDVGVINVKESERIAVNFAGQAPACLRANRIS